VAALQFAGARAPVGLQRARASPELLKKEKEEEKISRYRAKK